MNRPTRDRIEVSVDLCDPLNPGFGWTATITAHGVKVAQEHHENFYGALAWIAATVVEGSPDGVTRLVVPVAPTDDEEEGQRPERHGTCLRCQLGLAAYSHTCGGGGRERTGEPGGRE